MSNPKQGLYYCRMPNQDPFTFKCVAYVPDGAFLVTPINHITLVAPLVHRECLLEQTICVHQDLCPDKYTQIFVSFLMTSPIISTDHTNFLWSHISFFLVPRIFHGTIYLFPCPTILIATPTICCGPNHLSFSGPTSAYQIPKEIVATIRDIS